MKNITAILMAALGLSFYSCQHAAKVPAVKKIQFNMAIIDSLGKASDSSYVKPYYSRDFVQADYYVNKKDSTVAQVMKDTGGKVRQVIFTKNKNRIYTARYYPTGQLVEKVSIDRFGQYDGQAISYFENGSIESVGNYRSGFKTGKWKTYDSTGVYVLTEEYNTDGQKIRERKE